MINVIDMYERPKNPGVEPGESSDDVLNKYMQYMYPAPFARASHPVFVGDAAASALDLMNAPEMRQWTRSALMRYRSRRDMMEITINPAFSGPMTSNSAMHKTIAFPLDPWFQLGDPRLVLAFILSLIALGLSWREALAQRTVD